MSSAAIVLCAGMGSRLGELGRDLPKPMLPFGGRPMLDYTLWNLAEAGIREVGVNGFHHAAVLRKFVGDGSRWGLQVHFVEESAPSGTAGAFVQFAELVRRHESTVVHYGDILTNADLAELLAFHRARRALGSLLVHRSSTSNSVVVVRQAHHESSGSHPSSDGWAGEVTQFIERPSAEVRATLGSAWTNSGIYCLDPSVLDLVPRKPIADFPADVFPSLVAKQGLYALPIRGRRWAIDTADRYAKATEEFDPNEFS